MNQIPRPFMVHSHFFVHSRYRKRDSRKINIIERTSSSKPMDYLQLSGQRAFLFRIRDDNSTKLAQTNCDRCSLFCARQNSPLSYNQGDFEKEEEKSNSPIKDEGLVRLWLSKGFVLKRCLTSSLLLNTSRLQRSELLRYTAQ
jgi:hypothetical protein